MKCNRCGIDECKNPNCLEKTKLMLERDTILNNPGAIIIKNTVGAKISDISIANCGGPGVLVLDSPQSVFTNIQVKECPVGISMGVMR